MRLSKRAGKRLLIFEGDANSVRLISRASGGCQGCAARPSGGRPQSDCVTRLYFFCAAAVGGAREVSVT